MIIFESKESIERNASDTERFEKSYAALASAGIGIGRIMCTSPDDIKEKEAREIIDEQGMSALPITVFQGVSLGSGEYPSDQDLADFLDAPDGTLSVNKQGPPSMGNDIMPACACGNRPR